MLWFATLRRWSNAWVAFKLYIEMNKASLATGLLAALFSLQAHSKDLGVQGTVFPIVEIDMRQSIREQLEAIDQNRIRDEAQRSAKAYIANLPKRQLPTPLSTTTLPVDLSFTLTSDIQAPVKQADGTVKWETLQRAGTKLNPLDGVRPQRAMLFIDGSQKDQVQLAKKYLELVGAKVHVVEAGAGDVVELAKALQYTPYHADDRLLSRFKVTQLPSLLYAGTGSLKNYMLVTSFARPFKVSEGAAWPILHDALQSSDKNKKRTR